MEHRDVYDVVKCASPCRERRFQVFVRQANLSLIIGLRRAVGQAPDLTGNEQQNRLSGSPANIRASRKEQGRPQGK